MDSSNVFAGDDDSESDDQLVDIYYTALDYYRGTYTSSETLRRQDYSLRPLIRSTSLLLTGGSWTAYRFSSMVSV